MSQNVILADAEYLDHVAFDLIVNFERILGRRIPPADLPLWLDCIALDGGLQAGDHATQVAFIHSKGKQRFEHFQPADFEAELNGKAFRDELGEFAFLSLPVEPLVSREEFVIQAFEALLLDPKMERIMVIADFDGRTEESVYLTKRIKQMCQTPPRPESDDTSALPPKKITLFSMEPLSGRGFSSEILGYSLTAALGVQGSEFQ